MDAATGKELWGRTRPRTLMATSVSCHRPKCTRPMDPSPMTFLKVCSRQQSHADEEGPQPWCQTVQLRIAAQGNAYVTRQEGFVAINAQLYAQPDIQTARIIDEEEYAFHPLACRKAAPFPCWIMLYFDTNQQLRSVVQCRGKRRIIGCNDMQPLTCRHRA